VSLRRQLVLSLLLLVVVVLSAVAVYLWFGGPQVTLLDAFYMAVVTISTVGYSEIVSTQFHPELRLFNIFFILIGIGIMLYVFSVSTAFIVEGELNHFFRRRKMQKQIRDMHDHLIICGAGETGTYLVKELLKTGNVFVGIDHDQERLEKISQLGEVPGFVTFQLLRGPEHEDHVLYASHTLWNSYDDFIAWTKSEQFRDAHKSAGDQKPKTLGRPEFEGFEVIQSSP